MFQEDYEEFSDEQIKVLEHYVSNISSNVFVLRNLPEVIKGALFSRYSRSSLGLRSLLLKEFISNEETGFSEIAGLKQEEEDPKSQILAIKKAQNFYDRILDGYGDDSIGELGGAHIALENVSMLAAKLIEDCRIGGSPLEKSTRYVYFDQKVKGEYLFYREPIIMASAYRQTYVDTCNMLFETYTKLVPPMTAYMEERFPRDEETSKVAYTAALRARVLDCLRGLLPVSTLTNMGIYGNGRFFETLIQRLQAHNLAEMQDVGRKKYQELNKVLPSFVRRSEANHRHFKSYMAFNESMLSEWKSVTSQHTRFPDRSTAPGVKMVSCDEDAVQKVAAALLFAHSDKGLDELKRYVSQLSEDELAGVFDSINHMRTNRRHKAPRAAEHANFTFEIIADFGIYRDLQRHRMLTQERQLLGCDYGFYIPPEVAGTEMESDYCMAMKTAEEAFQTIASELPEEAQYVVPMAYNIRWYFTINLRALQWLCELRSQPAGHPNYRFVAQEMAKQVCARYPVFDRFFKFVDYDGYELGRLQQEERKLNKKLQGA